MMVSTCCAIGSCPPLNLTLPRFRKQVGRDNACECQPRKSSDSIPSSRIALVSDHLRCFGSSPSCVLTGKNKSPVNFGERTCSNMKVCFGGQFSLPLFLPFNSTSCQGTLSKRHYTRPPTNILVHIVKSNLNQFESCNTAASTLDDIDWTMNEAQK